MKKKTLLLGLTATAATLLALTSAGYSVAKSDLAIGWVDGWTGVEREHYEDLEKTIPATENSGDGPQLASTGYAKKYKTIDEYINALKQHAIKQGEEGFALLKNDNNALPLASGANVAVFGWNGYNLPTGHTGVVSGGIAATLTSGRGASAVTTTQTYHHADGTVTEGDVITLSQGLTAAGIKVNSSITKDDFTGAMTKAGITTKVDDETTIEYKIPEVFAENNTWNIAAGTIGIVTVGRGGGEGNNYLADSASNASDPLALSEDELKMIDYSKAHCSKTIVLVVSANAMELGPIAKGGEHEVDAIGFCGIPNGYQYQGIANVLAGKANATGHLTDTYAYDNSFNPAVINMGEQQWQDKESVLVGETPDELGRTNLTNLYSNNYIVEAEGVYVGYKYYESRYYDCLADNSGNAKATIGSTKKNAEWNYANEVVYPFGYGLSYIPYTQKVTDVKVTRSENGNVTATVEVTNKGETDGDFIAQLYVNRPYTDRDKTDLVEKSAVDFLNSKKVNVKAGETVSVDITVPTKYLASWDSKALDGAGTYILDEGDYYFTAANGAHEAVNNFLTIQGHKTDETTEDGGAKLWKLSTFDNETFATSNGYKVRNQANDGVDINYWLPDSQKVTYLSRNNWENTFPKNYTNYENDSGIKPEAAFKLADSPKAAEWIKALRNIQYVPKTGGNAKVEATLPEDVGEGKKFATVWDYVNDMKVNDPASFCNINSDKWQAVAKAINLNVAVGNILNGGGQTDSWEGIGNPTSTQSESVAGYSQSLMVKDSDGCELKMNFAVCSNTLLASSFDPDLAYEWGLLEGECGLWLMSEGVGNGNAITVWGGGLNLHRTPYNGRNSEYMSEDPMLTNRIGAAQYKGNVEMGAINGPKHMGFNDQELNRQGNGTYMTEQKMRETDIRCYQGALSESHATGVMMSFARLGAINVTNHVGLVKHIMREEWGFTGIISTDMGMSNYHEPYSIIMATINEYAGFGSNDAFIGTSALDFSDTAAHKKYAYVTIAALKGDEELAEQARQTSLYSLYTIAHSADGGLYVRYTDDEVTGPTTYTERTLVSKIDVAPWEYGFISLEVVFGLATAVACVFWVLAVRKEQN